MSQARPPLCIACSIFRREIEALHASGRFEPPAEFLDSMLHLVPASLEASLQEALRSARDRDPGRDVVLAYGDCCGRMEDLAARPGTARTGGINCCEIILGTETYRRLRKEGVFFFLPEWTVRWKEVFQSQLGLLGPDVRSFMREMHTRILYLDTGLVPVPRAELAEAADYLGLPAAILPVSLDHLLASLEAAVRSARRHG